MTLGKTSARVQWRRAAGVVAALLAVAAAGSSAAACPEGAPTGFFEGSTDGPPKAQMAVTLNLVCADGRYLAQVFTEQGDFDSREATGGPGRASLKFDDAAEFVTAELTIQGDRLAGVFRSGLESDSVTLARTGPPLAPGAMTPTLALTPAQWREDIAAFAVKLPKRHANAFFHLPKARFEAEISRLEKQAGRLNGDEVFVGLERIANSIGDGHTGVNLPPDRRPMPIQFARFGKDLRVVAVGPGLERALGARLVRIDRTPAAEAWARALTLTPQDELPQLQQGRAVSYLRTGLILHGLGITRARDRADFALEGDDGKVFTVNLTGLAPGASVKLTKAAAPGLAQQNPGAPFWCRDLAEQHAVYCAFHAYQNLGKGQQEMFALIEKVHPGKLIIDMRENGGGDNTVGYRFLIRPLAARADLNRKGRLYVLVGALTFSAAMNNAAQFQDETQAILVGQQIGEKPNSYQEPRQFRLPNSHLIVRASSLYYEFRKHGPNAVTPDKTIIPTWDDVKAGRDPVLDWVLAQPAA